MSLCAGAISFGDVYWPRFGQRFLASIERADPQPDQIVIVSDRPLDVPSWVELVVVAEGRRFLMYNDLAQHCRCDWLMPVAIDDEYTVDAFVPVESDADVICFPGQQAGGASWIAMTTDPNALASAWNAPNNPINGGVIWRTSTLREIPMRDYIYHDEVLWAEWSYFGKKLHLDSRVRVIWHRWSGSNSWPANHAGEQQAQEFKRKLREGLIQKGIPE